MDKQIFSAPTLRLNKSVALCRVEPLHGAFSHFASLPMLTFSRYRLGAEMQIADLIVSRRAADNAGTLVSEGVEESMAERPYALPVGHRGRAAISFRKRCSRGDI